MPSILGTFAQLFDYAGVIFQKGGWIALTVIGLYLLWEILKIHNNNRFLASVEWIMLSIDIPKESTQSLLAVEQIFAQLHSTHASITFGERVFHGKSQLWLTFEIVSFGGQTKYLAHLPVGYRNVLESAIYAQYPDAEIKQVEDYMKNVPFYDPDKSYYDIWGTEYKLKKEDAYPIRTYRAFEHQAAETIVDPLAGALESLSSLEPYELMAIQYQILPVQDEWKEKGRKLVKQLKGEKDKDGKSGSFFEDILAGAVGGLIDIFSNAGGANAVNTKTEIKREDPPTMMMHLSPGERDVIAAIETNLSKIGYKTKIRVFYMAPKEKFRKEVKTSIIGAFRQFDDTSLNNLKPDTSKIWTGTTFKFSETIERPYVDYITRKRKKALLRHFKTRNFNKGLAPFVFNIEELATVFHFPLETVKTPQLGKLEMKKGEAPINLPRET